MTQIIDATDLVLGRMGSYVAKQALLGEDIIIVNAEKARISGKSGLVIKDNLKKLRIKNKGTLNVGPYHHKRPDKYVRKSIRGMLPWEKMRGREAFKRVMVYIGEPADEIKKRHDVDTTKEKKIELKELKKNTGSYITVGELCKTIGGKW